MILPLLSAPTILSALAGLAVGANAATWTHDAGGPLRTNAWPVSSITATRDGQEDGGSLRRGSRLGDGTPIAAYFYVFGQEYHLAKKPTPLELSDGTMVALSDDCVLAGLPDPDLLTAGAAWSPTWVYNGAVDRTVRNTCPGMVVDEYDNIYVAACAESAVRCFLHGVKVQNGQPMPMWPKADLGGVMRILEIHSIGLLYTSTRDGYGTIWVPLEPLFSNATSGLVGVSTRDGSISLDFEELVAGASGMVKLPDLTGREPDGVAVVATYLAGTVSGSTMVGFGFNGQQSWQSNSVQISASTQPHPLYDPFTDRIFVMGFKDNAPASRVSFKCIQAAGGASCSGWPVNGQPLADNFGGFTSEWIYGGAAVPDNARSSLQRIIYTVNVATAVGSPMGCIIAMSPVNGGRMETWCLPRPANSLSYIASSPLVALDARGKGAHTVFFLDFNANIYAMDAMNLGGGLLYSYNPIPAGDPATLSSDYLTMCGGGTLVFPVWRDAPINEFAAVAVQNVLSAPASSGPASGGLSSGASAAIAITVLGMAGAGALYYKRGGTFASLPGDTISAATTAKDWVMSKVSGGSSYKVVSAASTGSSSGFASSGGYGSVSASSSSSYQSSGSSGTSSL